MTGMSLNQVRYNGLEMDDEEAEEEYEGSEELTGKTLRISDEICMIRKLLCLWEAEDIDFVKKAVITLQEKERADSWQKTRSLPNVFLNDRL